MHAFLTSARDEVAVRFTFPSLRCRGRSHGACSTGASVDRGIDLDAMANKELSAPVLNRSFCGPPRCPVPVPTELRRFVDIMKLPGKFSFG